VKQVFLQFRHPSCGSLNSEYDKHPSDLTLHVKSDLIHLNATIQLISSNSIYSHLCIRFTEQSL